MNRDLSQYKFSDWAEASGLVYLGYVDDVNSWYIVRYDTSNLQVRYAFGDSGYTTNWTARASASYNVYNAEV